MLREHLIYWCLTRNKYQKDALCLAPITSQAKMYLWMLYLTVSLNKASSTPNLSSFHLWLRSTFRCDNIWNLQMFSKFLKYSVSKRAKTRSQAPNSKFLSTVCTPVTPQFWSRGGASHRNLPFFYTYILHFS